MTIRGALMNLSRAAALALLGWYLMVPPIDDINGVQYEAPLSKWSISHVFDSAAECESVENKWYARAEHIFAALDTKGKLSSADKNLPIKSVYEMDGCRCIASDDSRLKGN